ncbi:MAG TPA: FxsA family protein [Solirubrobacteraceae bacterium]|jgi:UPF0716 protein FxsA|nr:FxsA family protein [Solirubrobacteraceae bacterium]
MFLFFLAILVGLPVLEIYVIVRVGEEIGLVATVVLLVASSMIGVRLVRAQGRAVLRNFQAAIAAGRPPAREALDGALVFVGGALLIAPGFITDVIGAILLIPPTRSIVRRLIVRHYAGRVLGYVTRTGPGRRGPDRPGDIDGTAVDIDVSELPR